ATLFFTFYGLALLKKDLKPNISPLGNPAMPMKMPFGPQWFQGIEWNMPNLLMAGVPGRGRLLKRRKIPVVGAPSFGAISRPGGRSYLVWLNIQIKNLGHWLLRLLLSFERLMPRTQQSRCVCHH
ncbi:MAG: DsrE/DsrF/DrsH-like family protein, partial [Pseudomonadota bacterium]|nr:DsrE/DsrF/DrsH-like family protein [Pseudomonadota bacterium]